MIMLSLCNRSELNLRCPGTPKGYNAPKRNCCTPGRRVSARCNMGRKLIDITGKRFGRLLVVGRAGVSRNNCPVWICVCDCGVVCRKFSHPLRNGEAKSCGCFNRECLSNRAIHRQSHTELHNRWCGMNYRCNCETSPSWPNYGGRGITICERWKEFKNFQEDMGPTFKPWLTLERKDNNKGYSPDNCIWADATVQNNNKRTNVFITFNGPTHTFSIGHFLLSL